MIFNWFYGCSRKTKGSFNIIIAKSPSASTGWRVQARFLIELHIKDLPLLSCIKSFFNDVGTITYNQTKKSCKYSVVGFNDIREVIIPQFLNYPLQSAKVIDFNIWKECIELMKNKEHLSKTGLNKLVALKGIMNKMLSS